MPQEIFEVSACGGRLLDVCHVWLRRGHSERLIGLVLIGNSAPCPKRRNRDEATLIVLSWSHIRWVCNQDIGLLLGWLGLG